MATGISEHDNCAVNFIEATRQIKQVCPGAKVSGGVSNIPFHFAETMLSVKLRTLPSYSMQYEQAWTWGLLMGQLEIYEEIPADLFKHVEDAA